MFIEQNPLLMDYHVTEHVWSTITRVTHFNSIIGGPAPDTVL